MDYDAYRSRFFANPAPQQRFAFAGLHGLTLLKGNAGNPQNVEVMVVMQTPEQAERLQAAFIAAGGKGEAPSDQLMYEPVRYCPLRDPFGTHILITSPLPRLVRNS